MRKITSILLAFVLALTLAPTAWADLDGGGDTQSEVGANETIEETVNVETGNIPELSALNPVLDTTAVSASEGTEADIVFIIDSTGSMGNEIDNVKENLNAFTRVLDDANLNFRIAVVEYRDITVDGDSSTKILQSGDDCWFTTAEEVQTMLSAITVNGGGDGPETVLDALGCAMAMSFRDNASKFAFLLTDADYKTDNKYGYTDMSDAVSALQTKGVSVSVISSTDYLSTYNTLYTEADGIFCDINGNFSEELVRLAEYIKKVVEPVEIRLETSAGVLDGDGWSYTLTATISATDTENHTSDLTVALTLPDGVTTTGDLAQAIADLNPAGSEENTSETLTWSIRVPVTSENTNYTWSVKVTSDDFATGVVCSAQDTFTTIGQSGIDYNWVWGRDNYSFLNTAGRTSGWFTDAVSGFGKGSYYINKNDLDALRDNLSETEIVLAAKWFTEDESVKTLIQNKLVDWSGSCYGMAVTAALFKGHVGTISPEKWGGTTTYTIPAIAADTNGAVESMINYYHISQVAMDQRTAKNGEWQYTIVANEMWDMASNIGVAGELQQPFIVCMYSSRAGHAVVCYGAESGNFSFDGSNYTRRLLIADPNKTETTYIYLGSDSAVYSANSSYTKFGYSNRAGDSSLSAINAYDLGDSRSNHNAKLTADNNTKLAIESGEGRAVIIANKILSAEGMEASTQYIINETVDDIGDVDMDGMVVFEDGDATYKVSALEDEAVDFTLTYGTYSARIVGNADSATLDTDGTVHIDDADGAVLIELAVNDSSFDFITIEGDADGDVTLEIDDETLSIGGELTDYTIENMDRETVTQVASVNGNGDAVLTIDNGTLSGMVDTDNDGIFETPLTSERKQEDRDDAHEDDDNDRGGTHYNPSQRIYYTLTFETNGGSFIAPIRRDSAATIDLAGCVPTKVGYKFAGWFSDSALTKTINSATLDHDMTVYAKWIVVNSAVTGDLGVLPYITMSAVSLAGVIVMKRKRKVI